jgi:hypothetical protein
MMLVVLMGVLVAALTGQSTAPVKPEKFNAIMNAGAMNPRPMAVDIGIDRWGTDADRERLGAALKAGGQAGLAMALRKEPTTGYVFALGHERLVAGYVEQQALPDGGRKILLLCVRRPGEWEISNDTGRTEHLFRVVELKLDARERGTGTLYHTAKVGFGETGGLTIVDELSGQPTALLSLRKTR